MDAGAGQGCSLDARVLAGVVQCAPWWQGPSQLQWPQPEAVELP